MPFSQKFLRTPGLIEVAGRQVKRYHVSTVDAEIEDSVQAAAYGVLPPEEPDVPGYLADLLPAGKTGGAQ